MVAGTNVAAPWTFPNTTANPIPAARLGAHIVGALVAAVAKLVIPYTIAAGVYTLPKVGAATTLAGRSTFTLFAARPNVVPTAIAMAGTARMIYGLSGSTALDGVPDEVFVSTLPGRAFVAAQAAASVVKACSEAAVPVSQWVLQTSELSGT